MISTVPNTARGSVKYDTQYGIIRDRPRRVDAELLASQRGGSPLLTCHTILGLVFGKNRSLITEPVYPYASAEIVKV